VSFDRVFRERGGSTGGGEIGEPTSDSAARLQRPKELWGAQPGQPQQSYRDRPDGGPAITDPADLPAQARLAHRGGSYRSQPADLRCTARGNAPPDSKVAWRGFRVAMEV